MNNLKDRLYKEALPKETLKRIQSILNEIDLMAYPISWNNPFNNVYSVRIEALEEDGSFGSNGKGRNQIFALASAYAEFLERIQNQLISGSSGFSRTMLTKSRHRTKFHFYPDEISINKDALLSLPKEILDDIFSTKSRDKQEEIVEIIYHRLRTNQLEGLIAVPFYDLQSHKNIYIPHNLLFQLTGSNGMAAGNTISEATFQALCEIYERNAASIIYSRQLTPPTIDKLYLQNYKEEYSIISQIESKDYKVIVKDFSCGIGLPVVGLILIDNKTKKYRLNVGSDTSFQVALSRTLTEIFQGLKDEEFIKQCLLEFPNKDITPYFYETSEQLEVDSEFNFKNFLKNGSGFFPPSLFSTESSYKFNPKTFSPKKSYEEEVKHLLKIAHNLDYKVYLRDVSFLGFPSVYVYLPNVSPLGKKDYNYNKESDKEILLFDTLENLMFPFNDFIKNKNHITEVINILEEIESIKPSNKDLKLKDIFRLDFKKDATWNKIPISFFLVLLNYLINDYKKAILNLEKFINENGLEHNEYYKSILLYLNSKTNKTINNNIDDRIIEDFRNESSLFKYIGHPNCPECDTCTLNSDCLTRINYEKFSNIKNKFSKSIINQNKFIIYNS